MIEAAQTGSAGRHGPLWGARAHDWAKNEEQQTPTYEEAIRRTGLGAEWKVLEVGCGSGVFLRLCSDRGADVTGLDASPALLELARTRVPEADLVVGDMQFLPFPDGVFDLVAGFNAFFFAADMVEALREAARVARPGAPVVVQVWGDPARCDLTAVKEAVRSLLPPTPDVEESPRLWEPGVLEGLVTAAGLRPETSYDLTWAYRFPDEHALATAMLAPGLVVEVVDAVGEEPVRNAILEALEPYRTSGGGYRLQNAWHTLIARA